MRKLYESPEVSPFELAQAANTLSKVVGAIGTLNSSQVVQRKYHDEKLAKQQAKLDEMQSEGEGISVEWMDRIRTEVLGMT